MASTNTTLGVQSSAYLKSLVSYVNDVKPFRTKLSMSTGAVSEKYLFSDTLSIRLTEAKKIKSLFGADLLPAAFTSLGVRTRETSSWWNDITSDGVRTSWPIPNFTNPMLSSFSSSQRFTAGVNDYQGIPGLTSGALDPKTWVGPGITDVRVNGVHAQDTVDYFLSHGVFSFDTLGVVNGVPQWMQHDLKLDVPAINSVEATMSTGAGGALAAHAAFSPQPGDLSYADVQRSGGTITRISGQTYEEFYLRCTAVHPATLTVYSSSDKSTLLGTAVLGSTFTLTGPGGVNRIQFTFTYEIGQVVETATIGDEYLITPQNKIVVSPTAPVEVWSLIKSNPIGLIVSPTWNPSLSVPRTKIPALEVHARSIEFTPQSTWSVTFHGDGTYTLTSSLPGYPVTVSLLNGCSYRDANIAFTLIPTSDGWVAGDSFTWQLGVTRATYKVFGSVSGWQPNATVGQWYWNGKIGFKVPALEIFAQVYNSTISTSTSGGAFGSWTTEVSGAQVLNAVSFSNGIFLTAGTNSIVGGSTDGVSWTNNLSTIFTPSPHELIIVTGQAGFVAVSADGVNWVQENPGVTVNLNASINIPNFLASPGSATNDLNCIIVAGDSGTVLTSIDGTGWAHQTSGTTNDLNGLAWSSDAIIAVGALGTVLRSTDRLTWSSVTSNTTATLNDIIYVSPSSLYPQGVFTAVGESGTIIRSTDGGLTWSNLSQFLTGTFSSVACGGGRYVAVGPSGYVAQSVDGIIWTRYSGKIFSSVAYGAGKFVTVGGSTNSTPQFIQLAPVSAMSVPSSYTITFTAPSSSATGVHGQATVYNNISGFKSNLLSDMPWSDEFISFQLNTIPGTFDYSIGDVINVFLSPGYPGNITPPEPSENLALLNIPELYNNEVFPLYHSHGAVIFPALTSGSSVIIDKAASQKIRLKITGSSSNHPELASQLDWIPLYLKAYDVVDSNLNPTSKAEFSDLQTFIEAFSASTGQLIFYVLSPRYLTTNRAAQSTLVFDQTFFNTYLTPNTSYSIVVQPDQSYGQTIRVKMTDNLKVYARVGLDLEDISLAHASESLNLKTTSTYHDAPSVALAEGGASIIEYYDVNPFDVLRYDESQVNPVISVYERPAAGVELTSAVIKDGLSIAVTVTNSPGPGETVGERLVSLTFDSAALQPGGFSTVPTSAPGLLITAAASSYSVSLSNLPASISLVVFAPESNHLAVQTQAPTYLSRSYTVGGSTMTATDPNTIIFTPPSGITAPFRLWVK